MKTLTLLGTLFGAATAISNGDTGKQEVLTGGTQSLLQADNSHVKLVSITGPVLHHNFPDPSIVAHGGYWWAFGTNNAPKARPHVQVASSRDFTSWKLKMYDPLFDPGKWSAGNVTRSPSVLQRPDSQWMLFYTSPLIVKSDLHCIGTAVGDGVPGPYWTSAELPLICPVAQGGASDAAAVRDADGTPYLAYRVGEKDIPRHGGACSKSASAIVLQQLSVDLNGTIGEPVHLLTNEIDDGLYGPGLASPSLVRSAASGMYFLFFSTVPNCVPASEPSVQYATASSITGPYTRQGPLIERGTAPGLVAPGGVAVDGDGRHMVFHAECKEGRCLYVAEVELE